ncbi:MAG: amino acid adenylation domain-containing protein [Longimicrobiales bacterium]|nr:amino acid adenylation domain-containing protein [Longimicrobiales bacterium]
MAAVAVLMGRYAATERVSLAITRDLLPGDRTGSPRDAPKTGSVGESPATVRVELGGGITFGEVARSLAARLAEIEPAEDRETEAGPPRILIAAREEACDLDGVEVAVLVEPCDDGIEYTVRCDPELHTPASEARTSRHLQALLRAAADAPDTAAAEISFLTAEERHQVVEAWNETASPYPRKTIHELFRTVARRFPDAVALDDGRTRIAYRELDRDTDRMARYLARNDVRPGDRVGIRMARSHTLIRTVLAVLKAGGTYVPLDPDYPAERLAFLAQDARVDWVLVNGTDRRPAAHPAGSLDLDLAAAEEEIAGEPATPLEIAPGHPDDPAYVMYTSGSTGRPKGVLVPHRAVVRLVRNTDVARLDASERILCFAPASFDASTLEIWGALLNGGCLVVFPGGPEELDRLPEFVEEEGVTTLWLTAGLFHRIVERGLGHLRGVRQLLAGGDVLSPRHVRQALEELPGCTVINGYGPTENTTFTCCHSMTGPGDVGERVPIGRPIANTRVYVLDPAGQPVPVGVPGELYAGGDGVALGYMDRPDENRRRFLPDPFAASEGARMYRTGDRVRHLPDGALEFLGRMDEQVKIRGYRIEPGEIEIALTRHPEVRAAVVVPGTRNGETILLAFAEADPERLDSEEVAAFLRKELPVHMIPARVTVVEQIPVTASGKVDRNRLVPSNGNGRPAPPESESREGGTLPPDDPPPPAETGEPVDAADARTWEARLARVWGRLLDLDSIPRDRGFLDLGGDSLLVLRMLEELRREHGIDLTVAGFFQHPTVRSLAAHLGRPDTAASQGKHGPRDPTNGASPPGSPRRAPGRRPEASGDSEGAVAIVGMAGRFPGADSVDALWRVLLEGRETTTFFLETPEGLDPSVPPELRDDENYVAARGVLEDADRFDPALFGMSPREAEVMDPQHRVFLETTWEAIEAAGYPPGEVRERVGVFAGMGYNNYFPRNVAPHRELIDQLGALRVQIANEKDYVAIFPAYKLGLRGPALSVHTACSTSLVAVALAVQSLRTGQCEMAVAGGVAVSVPQRAGYLYQAGGMLSADGHCRPFDRRATGTVFSDGSAAVVLKRLEDAEAAGDTVYAVIRGVGVGNDGATRASFTAPTVDGQADAIRMALEDAGWSADTVSYVEAHGTATPLGDPVEIAGLTQAFRASTAERGFCRVGSVKSNLGHLTAAAGVTGLIKTTLALHHRTLPGTVHFESANPAIDFHNTPFRVQAECTPWVRNGSPRRAGVSSFGVGGTNAHLVLEEYDPVPVERPEPVRSILLLSARSEEGLAEASRRLGTQLAGASPPSLGDAGYTLQVGRRRFDHRRFVVAGTLEAAVTRLADPTTATCGRNRLADEGPPGVVMVFPGQGIQRPEMARDLYETDPEFRADVDACAAVYREETGEELLPKLFPRGRGEDASLALARTALAQPSIFTVEYALARIWLRLGIQPRALLGHSLGEIAAATVAGVFTLHDAMTLVTARGRVIQALPPGSMLSVRKAARDVACLLPRGVVVAAENAPDLCAVSGPPELIAETGRRLKKEGVAFRELQVSHAFHSPMMDRALDPFRAALGEVHFSPPRLPLVSTVTGEWISDAEATDPEYWVNHIRAPVRFAEAVAVAAEEEGALFLEAGPESTASALVRRCLGPESRVIASLERVSVDTSDWDAIFRAIGRLWLAGVELEWRSLPGNAVRRRVALPHHPFDRVRLWLDPPAGAAHPPSRRGAGVPGTVVPGGKGKADLVREQIRTLERQLELIRSVTGSRSVGPSPGRDEIPTIHDRDR